MTSKDVKRVHQERFKAPRYESCSEKGPSIIFPEVELDVPLVFEAFHSGPWHASAAKGHVVAM